ncbi:CPSF3 [Symbiodinium microadriaticum]|nr:CPSF3 [Symbiodinium microadriaticum]
MNHSSREERESRFTSTVEGIVNRGGNCLIPVFALGRAQELLLILDEYWQSHPSLHDVPIFYASKLASKALRVYQTFVNMMNMHIQVDTMHTQHRPSVRSEKRRLTGVLVEYELLWRSCYNECLFSA